MKAKEVFKKFGKVVGMWLLGYAKKFWEEKLKEFLKEQIHELAKSALAEVEQLHDSVEYELKRQEIFDKIFDGIKLPLILKPFRWLIKRILQDAVEKKIQGALDKLKEAI